MERLLRIHVVIVAVLGAAMANAFAESLVRKVATFDLDGLTLSMPIEEFRQAYHGAELS